jgi:hypothetical protein
MAVNNWLFKTILQLKIKFKCEKIVIKTAEILSLSFIINEIFVDVHNWLEVRDLRLPD